MKIFTTIILILLFGGSIGWSQRGHQQLRKGDKAYNNRQYDQAAQHYSKAEEEQADFRSSYNLGNALMQQQKYEDAVREYDQAAEKTDDPDAKASIYHNLGNGMYAQEKYKESIDAYKKALTFRPSDQETLQNLMLAKKRLKQQQDQEKQQQQQKNSDQDKERNKDSDKSENQDSSDSKNQGKSQESGNSKQNAGSVEQQKQRLKENSSGLSDRDAGQLLEVMTDEEKRVQRKMTGKGIPKGKGRKDW